MSNQIDIGINEVAHRTHTRLQRYLEAQYHIRNSSLIGERRLLLEEPGGISQRPFIEVTPSYAVAGDFSELRVPSPVRDLLQELLKWKPGIGVYPPYRHQAEALEHFFSDCGNSDDLLVATGTGSGKTETFLYATLGMLAMEGTERKQSFLQSGIRAILLYPMNALVSDQTSRLRRLLGDARLSDLMLSRWGRRVRFGMYTSRTPYPGVRTNSKDKRHLDTLLGYYERLESSESPEDLSLVAELKKRGRWPAKDIVGFYGRDLEEKTIYKSGKKAGQEKTLHHWDERFSTQLGDRELLTRHEMHVQAPDLLITNYSMLEYMLLRPIERPLFTQTRRWLASDKRNQLLLVLDEAHMYRGVGGAEVGLLIRRLLSRLGIGRDRLRCILTTASLPSGNDDIETGGLAFARDLTGESSSHGFAIVRGTREARSGSRPGNDREAIALSEVSPHVLAAAGFAPQEANDALLKLSTQLSWPIVPPITSGNDLLARQHICRCMTGFGPLELLLEQCSGNGVGFSALAQTLFPSVDAKIASKATDGLLALGTFARRTEPSREEQPLLPTRVHLLFRGLPSLFACINPDCSYRRWKTEEKFLGHVFTEPRSQCECGGRVFEILTHRDCGAAFLRVFTLTNVPQFLWHERGGRLTEFGTPLHEIHLFLEEPHSDQLKNCIPVRVDIRSGRVLANESTATETRLFWRPKNTPDNVKNLSTFGACPACTRGTQSGGSLKIMDLATKGEQPFANLVREQFVSQLATKSLCEQHPNEGRKALLFSDGRQKAARLARDLPREVERDSFREALVLACNELFLLSSPQIAILDETIFAAFVAVCAKYHLHFFDGQDQKTLIEECLNFNKDFEDLDIALASKWRPTPPTRFRTALLRQISDPYYSLVAACAAVVEVTPAKLRLLQRRLEGVAPKAVIEQIATAWVREMLRQTAFDPILSKDTRQDEFEYFQPIRSADSLKTFFERVSAKSGLGVETVSRIKAELFELLTREGNDDSGRLLINDGLHMRLTLDETWLQCLVCGNLQLQPFFGSCGNCGSERLESRSPDHEYMQSRKGFFREPLRNVLSGDRPVHITAEEHTAQLSQRDAGVVYATTEQFELRFQDIPLRNPGSGESLPSVDILSCTTTMEVGIDIGSLTAVGLRTVPPQRENYQQRAGRAGRRGTSVSSVLMFAQGGAHDAHYFSNPHAIISGPPREPRLKINNARLARRHINSHLLQTFFHSRLDALSVEEQEEIAQNRPDLMSAFGATHDFFGTDGDFTFAQFTDWMLNHVLVPNSTVIEEVASWLPVAILPGEGIEGRRSFVHRIAHELLTKLGELRASQTIGNESEESATEAEEEFGLLDRLFDSGLLPSYAFPTDLCSFVIQEWDKNDVRVAERPQLAKAQALSEYAPGRLLVVNKKTYRVGGIFVEGPPTASPATELFAKPLSRYVGCPLCSFISIEGGSASERTIEGSPCPVCRTPLFVREYLDPPSFTPEAGRSLREGDREQDVTFASSAQLPEIAGQLEFTWHSGPGANLSHAYGEDVLLVVANKGRDAAGFTVCQSCGAAWLDGEEPQGTHARPFLVPRHILERDNAPSRCNGELRRGLFLVHDFNTDLLLLRGSFRRPLGFDTNQPWIYDGLATLAEALALGASLHLDIDPGELSAGYRLLPSMVEGEDGIVEIYLFDTSSGGAGYSADAGSQLEQVFDKTEDLLLNCPAKEKCERSCTKCLRHYGNRFLHGRLDRRLAYQLLRFFRNAHTPPYLNPIEQSKALRPLARYFELEGWNVTLLEDGSIRCVGPRSLHIGVYPALLASEVARMSHPISNTGESNTVLLPDYLIEHDLPSAYQHALNQTPQVPPSGNNTNQNRSKGKLLVIPVKEFRRSLEAVVHGTVSLYVDIDLDKTVFAVRIPNPGLRGIGFSAGAWVCVRPVTPADLNPNMWILLLKSRGHFGATGADWTIAHVKQLPSEDPAGAKLQVSYGSAIGREFRPERFEAGDLTLLAAVVCHADEAN